MTDVLVPVREAVLAAAVGEAAVARELALSEARRLLRSPAVLASGALSLLAMVKMTWDRAPVLNRIDVADSGALLLLAGGTLLACNAAALRGRSAGTTELLTALPSAPRARTLGLLAAVIVPTLLGASLQAAHLLSLLGAERVTALDLAELAAGPATVAVCGALGVALARWLPLPVVAPVGVVAIAVVEFLINFLTTGVENGLPAKWLIPVVSQQGVAAELLIRPAGWHLAYLIALCVALGAGAVLRHGADRATLLTALVAAGLVVATAVPQLRQAPQVDRDTTTWRAAAAAPQTCADAENVTYCADPGYAAWIDDWQDAVGPVAAQAPAEARAGLRLEQHPAGENGAFALADSSAGLVRPGGSWGRGAGEARFAFGLVLGVAGELVGMPRHGVAYETDEHSGFGRCGVTGQARAVVAFWLAAQPSPATARWLEFELDRSAAATAGGTGPGGLYFSAGYGDPVGWLEYGAVEGAYALELAARPVQEVGPLVRANWAELTDPATPTARAVELLRLDPVPLQADAASEWAAPPCP